MSSNRKQLIAVFGATGQQGGAVVRALQAQGQFKVRALTRNPDKHRGLADEVVEADLSRAETLKAAFAGAHGVFLVTNAWEQGTDEVKQATAAVRAAKEAGVRHFIWSTLPDVEAISRGTLHVPHFTDKAKADRIVREAGFTHHTFVIAPFFYQNVTGAMAPQKQADGSLGWALPIDPTVRAIHMAPAPSAQAIPLRPNSGFQPRRRNQPHARPTLNASRDAAGPVHQSLRSRRHASHRTRIQDRRCKNSIGTMHTNNFTNHWQAR